MRRRTLMRGGVALAAGVACPLIGTSRADRIAVRQDISDLARSPERLAVLAGAVGEMQRRSARDRNDPAGWIYHATSHAEVCSAISNADNAQVHGCWWFLPWHRAFLAVTEWKLRAISGDPSLALPYWNWSADRAIPPAYAAAGSPLANAVRHTPRRPLRATEVDYLAHDPAVAPLGVAALSVRSFRAWTPEQIGGCFGGVARPNSGDWHGRSRLETVPHNAIHNYVGGEAADGSLGDMTELGTAALDPIFYAHHANLDRLWEAWRLDPARRLTEPVDADFLDRQFVFPWLDGTPVAIPMRDVLDTRRLGYAYDTLDVFRAGAAPPAPEPAAVDPLVSATLDVPSRGRGERHILRIGGVLPGARPVTVEIVVAPPGEPATGISVGAFATGRRHSEPQFPDTEPRFDLTAALDRLRTPTVTVSVAPLPLGPESATPPAFSHAGMEIVSVA